MTARRPAILKNSRPLPATTRKLCDYMVRLMPSAPNLTAYQAQRLRELLARDREEFLYISHLGEQ